MKYNVKGLYSQIVLICFALVFLLAGAYRFRGILRRALFVPVSLSEMRLPDAANGVSRPICRGSKSCLVVYISPWCPSCKQHLPFVKEVFSAVKSYPGLGLEVVIGWDKRANLLEMAQSLGIDSLLDDSGVFSAAASVSSVPSWYLFSDGSLVRSLSPGADSAAEFVKETFLTRPIT